MGHRCGRWRTMFVLCAIIATTLPARAEPSAEYARLSELQTQLVPYSAEGSTVEALAGLAPLERSADDALAAIARFVRTTAMVDLAAYASVAEDQRLRGQLAVQLGSLPAELASALSERLRVGPSAGTAADLASLDSVVRCLDAERRGPCTSQLRRITRAQNAAASAARLLLVHRYLEAVTAAQQGHVDRARQQLRADGEALCASAVEPTASSCSRDATDFAGGREQQLIHVAATVGAEELRVLRRGSPGGAHLAPLAQDWLQRALPQGEAVGLTYPVNGQLLQGVELSRVASAGGAVPSSHVPSHLLIVGSRVSVALVPTTVLTLDGPRELSGAADYALPGRPVMVRATTRPFVRPIEEVTQALKVLRRQHVAAGESSLGPDQPGAVLALAIDRRMPLIDVARYQSSARAAGYHRFATVAQLPDEQLVTIPTEFASMENDGPRPGLPELRVGPLELSWRAPGQGRVDRPRNEAAQLAAVAAGQRVSTSQCFIARGRPMMPYRTVMAPLARFWAARDCQTRPVVFLLPP
jgi:hypothetical protein